jgi:hypothetical protein
MATTVPAAGLVYRTAHIRLRATRHQTDRCYRLLRAAGDLWAWLLDNNRTRRQHGQPPIANYQALCRQLTSQASFGELSMVGARSVLRRYADAWHQAARRRRQDQQQAGFPRRKHALVPVRFYHGTFQLDGRRVRLPVARVCPELWVRLARPIPYPAEQVRAVTLLADGGRLWLAVTAAVPVQQHDLDPGRVAGVDLGIIHPYAVITQDAALLVSGRAVRAEGWLHLHDQQARQTRAARRAPKPGQRGSRRWRRHRAKLRRVTPRASPSGMSVGPTTCGCGSGAAPTCCRHCGTRPNGRGSWCGWWTSAAAPPPARSATIASPSRRAAGLAAPLRVAGASGSGGCPQHRRQGWRRTHQHGHCGAGGAPSGRYRAGAA